MNTCWREAASIILTTRGNIFKLNSKTIKKSINKNIADLKVLVLKRGKSSKFFPGGYVFPGGAVDSADAFENWLDIFKSCNFKNEDLKKFEYSSKLTGTIFDTNACQSPKNSKLIDLRITAIRETFEESGILLCKSKHCNSPSSWASYVAGHEVHAWQEKVQKNANEFLNLCKEFECFPDIWSLHLWSNWLTPTSYPIRFDTAFFIVTLDHLPPSVMSANEMEDMKWCYPNDLISEYGFGKLSLPPPQFYEASRINLFRNIDEFNNFATMRETKGCERWMPILFKTSDGVLSILPGDEMYPQNVNLHKKQEMESLPCTIEELRQGKKQLHRIELHGKYGAKIIISNIESSCGHLLPIENTEKQ